MEIINLNQSLHPLKYDRYGQHDMIFQVQAKWNFIGDEGHSIGATKT